MKKIKLDTIKKIHFTGIKGVGMTSLALVTRDLGIKVEGSDISKYFVTDDILKKANINWNIGFKKDNISNPDLLIFTAAHNGEDNIEVVEAKKRGIPVLSHGQALALFMKGKIGISVCGVGGKTTTSAMLSTIFSQAGKNPSFAIGVASINGSEFSGKYNKKGKYFIAEADEYFASPQDKTPKFFYQSPKIIITTNIEYDHPDVYKSLDQTIKAFKQFCNIVGNKGRVIANVDSVNVRDLISTLNIPIITYGFSPQADWQILSFSQNRGNTTFNIKHNKLLIKNIKLQVSGEFNIKNALSALIAADLTGISIEEIKKGLLYFKGTKRRFELVAKIKGIRFYDDYAHHPLEIKATLKTARSLQGESRIIAIFQPHTYSRTKALFSDFSNSFNLADKVYITPIYASAREKKDFSVSGNKLAQAIKKYNQNTYYVKDKKDLIEKLKKDLKKNDMVITLGAGDIFTWHDKLIKII